MCRRFQISYGLETPALFLHTFRDNANTMEKVRWQLWSIQIP